MGEAFMGKESRATDGGNAKAPVLGYEGRTRHTAEEDIPPIFPNPIAVRSRNCGLGLVVVVVLFIAFLYAAEPHLGQMLADVLGLILVGAWAILSSLALVFGLVGLRRCKVPGVSGKRHATLGLNLGILGLIFFTAGALGLMVMARVGSVARVEKCRSNLLQIASACEIYAKDNGGRYPPRLEQLYRDADLNPRLLVCPASEDTDATGGTPEEVMAEMGRPGHCSYVWVGSGLTTSSPGTAVLAYEKLENHRKSGMNVLYANGTVVWLDRKAAEKLIVGLAATSRPAGR